MRAHIRKAAVILALAALAAGIAVGPAGLLAADHLDAPGLKPPGGDSRIDVNDVYAFQSPANPSHAVLIMTTNPAAGLLTGQFGFNPDASYEFLADTNGDAKPDTSAQITFGPMNNAGQQTWKLKVQGNDLIVKGVTGATTELFGGEVKVTAGKFDDPFFFDLINFLATDFSCKSPSNFFKGLNTQAIVFEFPATEVMGQGQQGDSQNNAGGELDSPGPVGIWARTMLGSKQIDRMGRPAINTVFIPNNIFEPAPIPSQRNAFNAGLPENDRRDFRGEVVNTLEIFYGAGSPTAQALADILLPDLLTVDFSSAAGFLNGRQLANDVIDAELGIVTNGAVTSDCVGNDSAFSNLFPYLAPAN